MERFLRSMFVMRASTSSPAGETRRGVFNAVGGDFSSAEVAFDVVAEVDDGALGVNGLHRTLDERVLVVGGSEVGERIAAHLLDAEGDAFTFRVDRENDGFEFVALLVLANGFFTGLIPGKVGEVDETVNAAGRPMNTPKSVMDLIWPETLSPFLWDWAKSSHGFGLHCFMPREMRRRSSSMSRTMTSTSSPSVTTLRGSTFLFVQSISETWTRPSMPASTSTKAP